MPSQEEERKEAALVEASKSNDQMIQGLTKEKEERQTNGREDLSFVL